ncbi:MAG: hypothetical protein PHI02_08330 [Sulfurovaceae bacterium]|nr:hypothetical protein [Sulfurovaceae bacterium]
MKFLTLIFFLFFLSGCENFPVYEEFSTDKKTFECLDLDINDTKLSNELKEEIEFVPKENCKYKLKGYIHNSVKCISLQAKTYGTDFDGYVYLEIKDNNNRLYRVQSDFKEDLSGAINRVAAKINTIVK